MESTNYKWWVAFFIHANTRGKYLKKIKSFSHGEYNDERNKRKTYSRKNN